MRPTRNCRQVADLGRRRLVLGRHAAHGVGDHAVDELEVLRRRIGSCLPRAKPCLEQRRVEQIAGVIAGERTPGPVRAAKAGRQPHDQQPRIVVTEGRDCTVEPTDARDRFSWRNATSRGQSGQSSALPAAARQSCKPRTWPRAIARMDCHAAHEAPARLEYWLCCFDLTASSPDGLSVIDRSSISTRRAARARAGGGRRSATIRRIAADLVLRGRRGR